MKTKRIVRDYGNQYEVADTSSTPDLMDLRETIDNLEDNMPADEKSKEYKAWKKSFNKVAEDYNKKAGFHAFRIYK